MSGQFANKQFGGDQFAGKQFGANEGDSGIVWLSANLTGSGAVAATGAAIAAPVNQGGGRPNIKFRPLIAAEARVVPVPALISKVSELAPRTGVTARFVGAIAVAGHGSPAVVSGAVLVVSGSTARARAGALQPACASSASMRVPRRAAFRGGRAHPRACAVVVARGVGAETWSGVVRPTTVHNPTDEELAALAVLLSRRA